MPIEVRRFGVGHRRPEGPPGSSGLEGQPIFWDARGGVAELVFKKGGRIKPHSNPNTTWFCVIEGGGWVSVADESIRVLAGEAVLWPSGEIHGAWTDTMPMRAIVVEFAGANDDWVQGVIDAAGQPALAPGSRPARGEGALAPRPAVLDPGRDAEGEPA